MKLRGLLITTQSIICVCMVRMYNYICPQLGLTSNSLHGPLHAWMTSLVCIRLCLTWPMMKGVLLLVFVESKKNKNYISTNYGLCWLFFLGPNLGRYVHFYVTMCLGLTCWKIKRNTSESTVKCTIKNTCDSISLSSEQKIRPKPITKLLYIQSF
jgi:hypothetical protein